MLDKIKNRCKATTLHYSIFKSTNDIPSNDWNRINNENNLFLTLDYLNTLENTLSATIGFRYIVFYDQNEPVSIAVTQLITFNTKDLKFQEFPCRISDAIKNTFMKSMDVRVLVCGNLFSCGEHGFLYSDKISAKEAFENLSDALREIRKTETSDKPSFILLKEFWPTSFDQSDYIKDQKFREFRIDVNMVLQLHPNWNDFEDYLSSMKTKFRTRAKKVFKKSSDIIIKDFTAEDIDQYKNAIDKLYLSVLDNADFKIGKLDAITFRNLKKTLYDSFIFKAYFLDDKLVGFTTSFILNNVVEANHIGIDYTYNKSHDVYQRMLYDYVDLSIQKNVNELRLGRTAEIIKSCVGAKPVEMKLYVRHGNSISNKLLKPLVEFISPSEYEVRNPFKLQLS
ncbi:hypothetical protein D1818_06170 [Aquimarina sp. BL5]|uniref:hypothetical protein n=1 Tax=Aquimarina sp. BL5 TaxID=1714860 RepID=UPI000E52E70C|nr:hypothetical protein [Aquimarina sp. BL5]AXT50434.1 hypothetical protein D1818_06170 [Aquimarina sp. BL5]RKN03090.1 hypothetical protein D7036_14835 [Aquimarina sp. BL5]